MLNIVEVDYKNTKQCEDLALQLVAYSSDIMGGGEALPIQSAHKSITLLAEKTYAVSFIAYFENQAIGFANCFESISTFAAKTLINIHDFAILPDYRGKGFSQDLLKAIETHASRKGHCKITLEVLAQNHSAKKAYSKYGFTPYELDPSAGSAQFWQKTL